LLTASVSAETSATPEQVFALAGTEFSPHRAKVWPNVPEKRLEVHERERAPALTGKSRERVALLERMATLSGPGCCRG
jgi:hypothetical protein